MKGTNDALNMCINKCIVNGWRCRAKLVKGDNYGRYKMINASFEMLYTQTHRAFFNKNNTTSLSGHTGYSEDYFVQNYSRQTDMYEMHCQAINQKCELDRHISIKIAVLYGSVGQYLT